MDDFKIENILIEDSLENEIPSSDPIKKKKPKKEKINQYIKKNNKVLTHNKTFRFRAYLSKAQQKIMKECEEKSVIIWNFLLSWKKAVYENEKRSLSQFDLINILKLVCDANPEFKVLYSQCRQDIAKRIISSYNNFFRRIKEVKKTSC